MNINKGIKNILSPEDLYQHLLAYTKIDHIMLGEDDAWIRVYHYDKNWVENGHFFKIDDSGGDHYHVLFSPDGCIIKGFDHECEMSPYNFDEVEELMPEIIAKHNFYTGAPLQLEELLNDPALEKELATFCMWQSKNEAKWQFAPIAIPDDWSDGIKTFLEYTPNLKEYQRWFEEDFYKSDLDFSVLEQIFSGELVTAEMIKKINPDADVELVLKDLKNSF